METFETTLKILYMYLVHRKRIYEDLNRSQRNPCPILCKDGSLSIASYHKIN